MARYTGSVCRLCRREGDKLFLKGDRCYTAKCAVIKRKGVAPGQHGQGRQRKRSEYGTQLREKQKVRRTYGLMEGQFKRTFNAAERMKGITGENLLSLLESRLDNVVYRLGMGQSRPQSRQLVTHGHFLVNGKKVDIPSYIISAGDVITVKSTSRDVPVFKQLREEGSTHVVPKWLELSADALEGKVLAMPQRDDVDMQLQEHLIVELYSR